jgi:hypothetical protein
MKRTVLASLVALVAVVAAGSAARAQAPALPSIDQILDKYVTAIGGRAALEKVTSRVSKGTMEIPDMGVSGTITISEKAPDKSLAVIEVGGMGVIRDGTDGVNSWEDSPQNAGGIRDKTGVELADAKRSATFNVELKMKSLYKTMAVTGRERVGSRDAYVVLATPAEGSPSRMFFDVENGLMVRQSMTRETPQGPMDVDVYLEDVREVEGIKQPFVVRQVTQQFTIVFRLSEIKYNVPLDDAMFKRPGMASR